MIPATFWEDYATGVLILLVIGLAMLILTPILGGDDL